MMTDNELRLRKWIDALEGYAGVLREINSELEVEVKRLDGVAGHFHSELLCRDEHIEYLRAEVKQLTALHKELRDSQAFIKAERDAVASEVDVQADAATRLRVEVERLRKGGAAEEAISDERDQQRNALRAEVERLREAHEYVSLERTRYRQERNALRAEVERLTAAQETARIGLQAAYVFLLRERAAPNREKGDVVDEGALPTWNLVCDGLDALPAGATCGHTTEGGDE